MAFKTSVLIFYLRLSKNTQKVLRLASWAVLVIVNLAGTVLTLLNIFQCSPVEAAFNRSPGQCIPLLTEFICSAPINIVTDLAILALPLPVLTSMRLPPRQKIILIITFTLGIFVTIVDVIRIYYLQKAITDAPSSTPSTDLGEAFGGTREFAWNASLALLWSAVEVNVGIACACIPTLKPLIIRILPAMIIDPDGSARRVSEAVEKPPTAHSSSAPDECGPSSNQVEFPTPSPAHQPEPTIDEQISALEFLTTPDMLTEGRDRIQRPMLSATATTSSIEASGVYFGFVNMRKPKSMIRTSVKDSLKYCTIVSILFLLWGFSYGLLDTLSHAVAQVSNMTLPETIGLTSIYFGAGYFFGPLLVGEWILRHDEHRRLEKRRRNSGFDDQIGGFKATFSKCAPNSPNPGLEEIRLRVSESLLRNNMLTFTLSARTMHLWDRDHHLLAKRRAHLVSRIPNLQFRCRIWARCIRKYAFLLPSCFDFTRQSRAYFPQGVPQLYQWCRPR